MKIKERHCNINLDTQAVSCPFRCIFNVSYYSEYRNLLVANNSTICVKSISSASTSHQRNPPASDSRSASVTSTRTLAAVAIEPATGVSFLSDRDLDVLTAGLASDLITRHAVSSLIRMDEEGAGLG